MAPNVVNREGGAPMARRLWRGARPFFLLLAGVVVVAMVAGIVFSRSDPGRAARLLIQDRVLTEPEGESTGPPAPSSGDKAGAPRCGVTDQPIDVPTQVDALASGIVVVQYRDQRDQAALAGVVAERATEILLAPNEDIMSAVVATAWGRRMRLDSVDTQLIRAFVTAHAGIGPDVTPCLP